MAVRDYDNTLRAEQAARTRARIIEAAGERFGADGYAATTIRGIAQAAGVSPETVYKSFGSKVELLRQWFEELTAGHEPVPVIQQEWIAHLRATPDRRRRIEIASRATAEIHHRVATATMVLAAAAHADEAAAALWDELRRQRRSDVQTILTLITARDDGTEADAVSEEMVDIAYALTEPHLHHVLVHERGWQPERYAAWLTELLWSQFGTGEHPSTKETGTR